MHETVAAVWQRIMEKRSIEFLRIIVRERDNLLKHKQNYDQFPTNQKDTHFMYKILQ